MSNKKNKRRRYMKINLLETSAVGIPAYPDAHMSFLKALSHTQLTERGQDMNTMSETVKEVAVESTVVEAVKEEVVAEVQKVEATVEVEKAVEKSADEKFLELINKAVADAVEQLTVKRGLVESDSDVKEKAKAEIQKMSAGELAIKSGWFTKF